MNRRLLSIFALLFLFGCTRQGTENSKVSFLLPTTSEVQTNKKIKTNSKGKITTQSVSVPGFANLSHAVINIGGPGIEQTMICHYDLQHDGEASGPCDFSAFPSVSVTVTAGSSRLIQIALLYSDSTTKSASFKYGDVLKDLKAGDSRAEIPLKDLGVGGEQGHVKGRFLTGINDGPTGKLEVKIKPEGRPSLTLMRTEMFSGWFSAFSMSGVEFEYVVNGNQLLFGKAISKTEFTNLEASGGPVKVTANSDGFEVIGFFGNPIPLAGKSVSSGQCTAASKFISCLDTESGFEGPFKSIGNNGGSLKFEGANGLVSWELLPGVEKAITDFRVLYNPTVDPSKNTEFVKKFSPDRGTYNCNFFESTPGTQVIGASLPVSQTSLATGIASVPSTALLAVCPRFGPISYMSAATFPNLDSRSGGNQNPYLRFEISTNGFGGNVTNMTLGFCYPAALKVFKSFSQGNATPHNLENGNLVVSNVNTSWMSFYTDSSCTTPVSGAITIGSGSSSSASLWAKATVEGNGLMYSPTLVSSDKVEFSPSQNTANVNLPQLLVSAPNVMVNNIVSPSPQMCYVVSVTRADSTGWPIGSGLASLVVNFNMNSNFQYFPNYADCVNSNSPNSGSGSVSIGSGNSNAIFYVKRISASMTAVPMNFTATDFTSVSYSVTGSTNAPVGTQFIISSANTYELGKCSEFILKHANTSGDEIPLASATSVAIASSLPEVQIYNDSMCSTVISSVSFPVGNSRVSFYVRTTSNTAANIKVSGGALSGDAIALMPAAPSSPTQPYLIYDIPKIKSVTLGSHEFPRVIPLSVHNSSSGVVCEQAVSPSFSAWSPCSGAQFSAGTNVFTWSAADAVSSLGFRFGMNSNGQWTYYYFVPQQLYSRSGQVFSVLSCDVTLAANAVSGLDNIEAALGNATICLSSGTFSGDSTPSTYSITNKKILGSTTPIGLPSTTIVAIPTYDVFSTNGTATIANINFITAGSGTNKAYAVLSTGAGTYNSINNVYQTDSYYTYGIKKLTTSADIRSVGDRFEVNGSVSASFGVYFNCAACTGGIQLFHEPVFSLMSTGGTYARGIGISQSAPNINLQGGSLDAVNNNGSIIESDQGGATAFTPIVLVDSSKFVFGGSSNLTRYAIYVDQKITLNINQSVFVNNWTSQQTIKTYATAASYQTINISNSKLVNTNDISAIFLNTTTFAQTLTTNNVHFIRDGNLGTTVKAIQSGNVAHNWSTSSTTNPKDTYFCGPSSNPNWGGISQYTPTGSIMTSGAPTVTNNLNSGIMMCAQ